MPQLSFEPGQDAKPIARVRGGDRDGEILYLHENIANNKKSIAPRKVFNRSRYVKGLADLKPAERTKTFVRLEEAYARGVAPEALNEPENIKAVYEKMYKDATSDKSIELDDEGVFELLPNPDKDKRQVYYIAGQSGSGKSWIAKQLAEYYHKLFPDRGVYLVSKLNEDATLDALKFLKRINIQTFVDDYPELDEFKDCMCIFDDFDTLTGDLEKVVTKIIDDLAIMGRHTNTTILCLSHYLSWGMSF
jgi:hypothetical protein